MKHRSELARATHTFDDGTTVTVEELVVAWERYVGRLADELIDEVPGDWAWGAYDVVAAMHARARLQSCIESSSADIRHLASEAAAPADRVFRRITEPDPGQDFLQAAHDTGHDGWWWNRKPRSGRPRRDYEEWLAPSATKDAAKTTQTIRTEAIRTLAREWEWGVNRLADSLEPTHGTPYVPGFRDFVSAVTARSTFARLVANDPSDLTAEEIDGLTSQADARFTSITEEDTHSALAAAGFESDPQEWWWFRVPMAGLPRRDLDKRLASNGARTCSPGGA
jgi:hypothetical protein